MRYSGNLKNFLDNTMIALNKDWGNWENKVKLLFYQFDNGINLLSKIIGFAGIGKFLGGNRFIKNLFDVEVYFFSQLTEDDLTEANRNLFIEGFKTLSGEKSEFRQSLTSSTNTRRNFFTRFELFRRLVNNAFQKDIQQITIPD